LGNHLATAATDNLFCSCIGLHLQVFALIAFSDAYHGSRFQRNVLSVSIVCHLYRLDIFSSFLTPAFSSYIGNLGNLLRTGS